MPVEMGPRTFPEPRQEPGVYFHPLPNVVTIRGFITAWDAGNLSVEERVEAREVDKVDDPPGMAAAII